MQAWCCRQSSLLAGTYTTQQLSDCLDAVNRLLPALAALDLPLILHQLAHRCSGSCLLQYPVPLSALRVAANRISAVLGAGQSADSLPW